MTKICWFEYFKEGEKTLPFKNLKKKKKVQAQLVLFMQLYFPKTARGLKLAPKLISGDWCLS